MTPPWTDARSEPTPSATGSACWPPPRSCSPSAGSTSRSTTSRATPASGTGTAYRRFPNKDALIDALMVDRIGEIAAIAEECLEDPDPWVGLTSYFDRALALQAADRGLKEVLVLRRPRPRARATRRGARSRRW